MKSKYNEASKTECRERELIQFVSHARYMAHININIIIMLIDAEGELFHEIKAIRNLRPNFKDPREV